MAQKSVTGKGVIHGTGKVTEKVTAKPSEVEIIIPKPVAKVNPIIEVKLTPIEEIHQLLDESPAVELAEPDIEAEIKPQQEVRFDLLPAVTYHIEHRGTHRAFDTDKLQLVNTCLERPDTYAVYAPNGALVRR